MSLNHPIWEQNFNNLNNDTSKLSNSSNLFYVQKNGKNSIINPTSSNSESKNGSPQHSEINEDEHSKESEFLSFNDLSNKENSFFSYNSEDEDEKKSKTPEIKVPNPEKNYKNEKINNYINNEYPPRSTNLQKKNNTNHKIEIVPQIANISIKADFGSILDLNSIAKNTLNVIYEPRNNNFLTIYLKGTNISANIFSSGKLVCTGIKTKDSIRKIIHKFGKIVRRVGHKIKIKNVKIKKCITLILQLIYIKYLII